MAKLSSLSILLRLHFNFFIDATDNFVPPQERAMAAQKYGRLLTLVSVNGGAETGRWGGGRVHYCRCISPLKPWAGVDG